MLTSTDFVGGENYRQLLLKAVHGPLANVPVLNHLFEPDRWMLWFGLVFVLAVYFFPTGIVGKLREGAARRVKVG